MVAGYAEQAFTGGKDAGEDVTEAIGTPGWVGRTATDGTDVWTCMISSMAGTTLSAWVKTFNG